MIWIGSIDLILPHSQTTRTIVYSPVHPELKSFKQEMASFSTSYRLPSPSAGRTKHPCLVNQTPSRQIHEETSHFAESDTASLWKHARKKPDLMRCLETSFRSPLGHPHKIMQHPLFKFMLIFPLGVCVRAVRV